MRRFIVTVCLVLIALAALAWPASRVGFAYTHEQPTSMWTIRLCDGLIWRVLVGDKRYAKPLERETYRIGLDRGAPGTRPAPGVLGVWHPPSTVGLRIEWIPAACGVLLLSVVVLPAARRWRRRRRGACLLCGYELGGVSPCPECGVTPAQAEERTGVWPRRAVRDAALGVFAVMLALSCGLWWTIGADERAADLSRAQAFDYSWYLETCQPRLDGRVAYAEPGRGPHSLEAALSSVGDGGTVVLLPGTYELSRSNGLNLARGLWLVGSGPGSTEVSIQFAGNRLRIDGVSIRCKEPFSAKLDMSGVVLRDCRVSGYDAGPWAYGISGSGSALLIESCEFVGKVGPNGRAMGGAAIDLGGDGRAFLRNDRFVDTAEVARRPLGVMDGCRVTGGAESSEVRYWARGGRTMFDRMPSYPPRPAGPIQGTKVFTECLDDLEPLTRLASGAGLKAWKDPVARELADRLGMSDDRELWRRLLKASSPEVRKLAAGRLKLAPPAGTVPLEDALGQLDQPCLTADVALSILSAGELAREGLQLAAERGAGPVQGNAAALLRLLDVQPSLPEMVRAEAARQK
jgi:hypothetical protein